MTTRADAHQGTLVSGRFPELEDALCERVAELKRGRPLAPVTVVVGSAAVRTRVADLLVRRLHGVANVDVVTLSSFVSALVGRRLGARPAVVAGLARERLLRIVADAEKPQLAYFAPVIERPHFAQALAATFADLREALVDPGSDWAAAVAPASAAGATGGGPAKAGDLRRLYSAYCAALAQRELIDGPGLTQAAAATPGREPAGGEAATILYGLYDLNRAQEQLVAALCAAGADVFVPLPRDADAGGSGARAAALAQGLPERKLAAPTAACDRDRLSAVWSASAQGRPSQLEWAGDGTLAVVSVSDERAEVREAVRLVMRALADGAAAWDVAVVVPHGDDVEPAAAALRAAALPVACRLPERSPGVRVLLRLADCVAPPAGRPFARRAVIDLLSAAPLAEPGESALWLDEARQAGIVSGAGQWAERPAVRRRGLEERLADLEARAQDAVDEDDEVSSRADEVRARLAAARRLEHASGVLVRACADLPARAGWSAWSEALAAVVAALFDQATAAEAADAAARLGALALLREEVDLPAAAAAVRELLGGARTPLGRVGRDGVAVLTPLEVRGLSFHTLVFTELAEGGFPARGRPDPLLGDAERRRVAAALGTRLPLAEQRDAESLYIFGLACEAARERLVLLAPRSSAADGRPRLPSRLLLRLAHLGTGRPVGLDEFLRGAGLGAVWRRLSGAPAFTAGCVWVDERERDTAQLLALSAVGRSREAQDYAGLVVGGAAAERRFGAWRSARTPVPGPWDGLLGPAARAELAARHPFDAEMHPTRLERYISCPFAFLLRDVFGLDAPDEPDDSLEMDAREFGTLAHAILQRTFERVMEEGLDREGARRALESGWSECCAQAEGRGVTGAALSWEVRREMLREDLLESLRRDAVLDSPDQRPVGIEWRFGEAVGRPVSLELPGGRVVRFAGRLDRVDEVPGGARIIDYKSGRGGTERNHIKERLSVQLPVYRLAMRKAGGAEYPAITCLYRLITRRGDFEDLDLPQSEDDSTRRLRALVAEAVALVDAGLFPRTTRQRCEYCDMGYACGLSMWARARKREHETLETVVHLQAPGGEDDGD